MEQAHVQQRLQAAVALMRRGETAAAEGLLGEVLAEQPGSVPALIYLALLWSRQGQLHPARELLQRAVELDQKGFEAWRNLGNVRLKLGDVDGALRAYERSLQLRPEAEGYHALGTLARSSGRLEAAVAGYDRALALEPSRTLAHIDRGAALDALGRKSEALEAYERALALDPRNAIALANRSGIRLSLGQTDGALSDADLAVGVDPQLPTAQTNRGEILRALDRWDEALLCQDRAIALEPGLAVAHNNRGVVLLGLKRLDEAVASFDRAIGLAPDYANAHIGRAMALLTQGRFDEGLPDYEWRPDGSRGAQRWGRDDTRWLGDSDPAGATLLVHHEQGFGDTIQFARFAPVAAALGARVRLAVRAPLSRLSWALKDVAVVAGEPAPDSFELHCPLLSLPLALRARVDALPSAVPYVGACAERVEAWRSKLPRAPRPRIGIAWSGSETQLNNRYRSIPLDRLALLWKLDCEFVALQPVIRVQDRATFEALCASGRLLDVSGSLLDFGETAALIATTDLVISVCTSVAHLAGALAHPVWVLLPVCADWRWFADRDDSPWYPTARLFRQERPGHWDGVVERVCAEMYARFQQPAAAASGFASG